MTVEAQQAPSDLAARIGAVRTMVLLAGTVRESPLVRGAQRSLLHLPLSPSHTVESAWVQAVRHMKSALGLHHLPVLFSCTTPTDFKSIEQQDSDERSFVADSGELRGTGGALRDLAERFEDNDRIIVANGNSSVVRPLHDVVLSMLNVSADVTLHADGALAPTGFMLIRAGVLRGIARRGFVDFKEQALPVIARDHSVRVVVEDAPVTVPIRTLDGYIRAVRAYGQGSNALALDDPFVEDWRFSFGLIEDGADVGKGAHVHDSVVLRGARVESGAVLVRSVAGPGAVVPNGPVICDQVLGESGEVE